MTVAVNILRAPLESDRLQLVPLCAEAAEEMVEVLSDQVLYEFIGGEPPSLPQLRDRYAQQVVGHSPDGAQGWFNWIVRRREDAAAVGTVQATLVLDTAEVAWVIGTQWQRCGYAREAGHTLVDALVQAGIVRVVAHIHPDHEASAAIARHLGMQVTERVVDGEREWVMDRPEC